MQRQDCCFIGDKEKKRYHKKNCPNIDLITRKNLIACGPNPENKGFKPCADCMPTPYAVPKEKKDSRAKSLRDALEDVAERNGMHLRVIGSTAYVTTVAGEWFFDYTLPTITLHHKNKDLRYDYHDNPIPGDYHRQKQPFASPLETMAYIRNHERSLEKRLFDERDTDLIRRACEMIDDLLLDMSADELPASEIRERLYEIREYLQP